MYVIHIVCVSFLQYITNEGTLFTFKTNLNAPRYKLINIDFSKPEMVSTLKIKVESVIYKKILNLSCSYLAALLIFATYR